MQRLTAEMTLEAAPVKMRGLVSVLAFLLALIGATGSAQEGFTMSTVVKSSTM